MNQGNRPGQSALVPILPDRPVSRCGIQAMHDAAELICPIVAARQEPGREGGKYAGEERLYSSLNVHEAMFAARLRGDNTIRSTTHQ